MIHKLSVKTKSRNEFVDVTNEIQNIVGESSVKDGYVWLFVPHTTAAVTINENADPSVKSDMIGFLNKLIPQNANFAHLEGNSDSHIKSSLVGPELKLMISDSKLVLGTWQGIYFCEFDGPRSRNLHVKVVSD